MTNETLIQLMKKIGSDKTYLTDGYYRIRDNKSGQKELAFLKPDGCVPLVLIRKLQLKKWMEIG